MAHAQGSADPAGDRPSLPGAALLFAVRRFVDEPVSRPSGGAPVGQFGPSPNVGADVRVDRQLADSEKPGCSGSLFVQSRRGATNVVRNAQSVGARRAIKGLVVLLPTRDWLTTFCF